MFYRTLAVVAMLGTYGWQQSPPQPPVRPFGPEVYGRADEKPILALPAVDGAWLVQVVTSGGLSGRGLGQNFAISSDGWLGRELRGRLDKSRLALSLTAPLGERLPSLEGIADAAVPASVCSDCIKTTLVVWRRGKPAVCQRWDVTTVDKLNPAVAALYREAMALMRSASGF